jgi:hypothetical protein
VFISGEHEMLNALKLKQLLSLVGRLVHPRIKPPPVAGSVEAIGYRPPFRPPVSKVIPMENQKHKIIMIRVIKK